MDDKANVGRSQSVRSVRTGKSKSAVDYNLLEEKPLDLDDFMELATKKFDYPHKIVVKKEARADDLTKLAKQDSTIKYKRISLASAYVKPIVTPDSEKDTNETTPRTSIDEDAIVITALYDNLNRLAEIILNKINVPRLLMQMLGLIVPHYQQLTKLVLKRCCISAYTIHEISVFLPLTTITDICLDDSRIPQGNYAMLLESHSRLNGLSLCRCKINDEVCKRIAATLHFLQPAETTLTSLNLSSNHITDVGAKYLGEALRTNRNLRYLNLADNRIGDEGANHIFHALIDFPLTYDETKAKRERYMAYLKAKQALYLKYLTQWDSRSLDDFSTISKKSGKKSALAGSASIRNRAKKDKLKGSPTCEDLTQIRAEMMTNELMGPFVDPFLPCFTKLVNGYCHCIGNMVLCYLNLCYNNISYESLRKLQKVLFYQSVSKTLNQTGLMKVLVEGNQLPSYCSEMERINEMLHRNVVDFSAKYVSNKVKVRARLSVARSSAIPEKTTK